VQLPELIEPFVQRLDALGSPYMVTPSERMADPLVGQYPH